MCHGDDESELDSLFEDVLSVEESVACSFRDVFRKDVWQTGQVCNGSRKLYDAGACAGGKTIAVDNLLQQVLAVIR